MDFEFALAAAATVLVASIFLALVVIVIPLLSSSKAPRQKRRRGFSAEDSDKSEASQKWLRSLSVSDSEVQRLLKIPQRTSTGRAAPEWLKARRHRLTASRFNQACAAVAAEAGAGKGDAGLCREQLLVDMVTQPESKRSPHRFGIANEAKARQSYVGYRLQELDDDARKSFSVKEVGLCVWRDEPWLAASPDGLVHEGDEVGVLEIKCCPNSQKMFSVDRVPPQFYDQVQGEMAIASSALGLQVTWCDFFVWSPDRRLCRRIYFDATYFHKSIVPKLRSFYFGAYMPVAMRLPVSASGKQVEQCVRRLAREGK
eukprot:TRINITY_DN21602_c0_g8_i1.p1 TRINITY_DN21602_c0_g8~~TRINITY_DN21602_c0_g8_i1.p1  ORF type:complete len:334 (-),score=50.30 TRINITY_DN21602_c0_g8_i1:435-1376(-)